MQFIWPKNIKEESRIRENISIDDDSALLCLSLLRKSNHEITKGVLMRFYYDCFSITGELIPAKLAAFYDAIRAVTAFYVLWRSSRTTTDSIDSHYRTLMMSGIKTEDGTVIIGPLSRDKYSGEILVQELKDALRYILAKSSKIVQITDFDAWVKSVSQSPIYTISTHISSFILLAAYNDTTLDNGIVVKGRSNISPLFNYKSFSNNGLTVEHIAPQTPDRSNSDWDWKIYDENQNEPNSLGNLTLLPLNENISIGNKSWKQKRVFYSALCAPTIDSQKEILKKASADGIAFKSGTLEILDSAEFRPIVLSLVSMEDFDRDQLIERGKQVASLAWKEFAPWLSFK